MNASYFRKLVCDELRETFFWCGLLSSWDCRSEDVDSKGKPFYRLQTGLGDVLVYGPKSIYLNDKKHVSIDSIKQELKHHVV
jgi:hypothetical protein